MLESFTYLAFLSARAKMTLPVPDTSASSSTDEEQKKGKCESLFVTDKELCYNIKVKVGVWPMDSLTITDRMIFSSENRDIAVRGNCCDLPNQF